VWHSREDVLSEPRIASPSPSTRDLAARSGLGTAPEQPGTRHPHDLAAPAPLVERAFAFVDLCGFTSFLVTEGEHAATEALRSFRLSARDIAARRGVQIAKWLGDGAMLVAHEVGPAIATAAELVVFCSDEALPLRGGIAHGAVLIFDGNDYIGRPTNLAARLCDAAGPGELLAVGYPADALPRWIEVSATEGLALRGIGAIDQVQHLAVVSDFGRRVELAEPCGAS
jgi:class 3 adenylate cyclase